MCYMLFLSTSSSEDLSRYNSELLRFGAPEDDQGPMMSGLEYEYKWFVGSSSGCSCSFRHLAHGSDLGFGEPEDWYPEDEDDIRATGELYRVIASLVDDGHRVDCVDVWWSTEPVEIGTLPVSLQAVPERAFRLFEDSRFVFES